MPTPNFPHIPPFRPFIPPMSLPAVYGDELSYMELLAKVEKWLSDLVNSNNLQNATIVALYAAWEEFKNGGYTDSFEEFLDQWFADNQEHIDELLTGQFADELAAIQETADGAVQTATEAEQAVAGKVNMPTGGTNGQVLSKAATATGTEWVDPIIPTDEQTETYINKWLNEHPEATTTVTDGSITYPKFAETVMDTNTRVLPPVATRFWVYDEVASSITGEVVDSGYLVANFDVNDVTNGSMVISSRGHTLSQLTHKTLTIVFELVSGPDIKIRIGITSASDWNPATNPLILKEEYVSTDNPIIASSICIDDVYTPLEGQDTIGFFAGCEYLSANASLGSYLFRFYILENSSKYTEFSGIAERLKDLIDYNSFAETVLNTNTRVLPPVGTRFWVNDTMASSISGEVLDSGYLIASLSVNAESNGSMVISSRGHTLSQLTHKTLTIVFELVSGPDIKIRIGITSASDWNPATNPLILKEEYVSTDNPIIASSICIDDVYTPLEGQDTIGFFAGCDTFSANANLGEYVFRFYILENSSKYTEFSGAAEHAKIAEFAVASHPTYNADIVFWGDSLTAGAGGNGTRYPQVCGESLGKTILNCGVGGETANTISARQGGNNVIVPAGAVNGEYALGELTDVFGASIAPLRQGTGSEGGNKIVINGYEATLSLQQTSATSQDAIYTISGYDGPITTVPQLAYFIGSTFIGEVTSIFVGQNGSNVLGSTDVNARIAIINSMIKHLHNNKYVVLGLSSGTDTTRDTEDATLLITYGSKFFPTRKMLSQYGLTVEGMTPTETDLEDISSGKVPTSLMSDHVHLNAHGYHALGVLLANKINSLGYFEE